MPRANGSNKAEVYRLPNGALAFVATYMKDGAFRQRNPTADFGAILKKYSTPNEIAEALLKTLDECE